MNGKGSVSFLNSPRVIGRVLILLIFLVMTICAIVVININYHIGELSREDSRLRTTIDDKTSAVEERLEQLREDLTPRSTSKLILFAGNSFLYNSWDHMQINSSQPRPAGHIGVWGSKKGSMDWATEDAERTGPFSYGINKSVPPDPQASSGGYVTFYEDPRDRLRTQLIRFRCKATSEHEAVDFGIRIAVDDPKAKGDRELATYQFDSVASLKQITEDWQIFEIHINHFKSKYYRPPFPQGLDANTLNKLVFYVDSQKVERCPGATLWFSNVELISVPSRQLGR